MAERVATRGRHADTFTDHSSPVVRYSARRPEKDVQTPTPGARRRRSRKRRAVPAKPPPRPPRAREEHRQAQRSGRRPAGGGGTAEGPAGARRPGRSRPRPTQAGRRAAQPGTQRKREGRSPGAPQRARRGGSRPGATGARPRGRGSRPQRIIMARAYRFFCEEAQRRSKAAPATPPDGGETRAARFTIGSILRRF